MLKALCLSLGVLCIIFLTGCTDSQPKCGDSDSKKLVKQMLLDQKISFYSGMVEMIRLDAMTQYNKTMSLEEIKNQLEHLELTDIFVESVDEKTKSTICTAEILVDKKSHFNKLHYKLQKSEDGKLFVSAKWGKN